MRDILPPESARWRRFVQVFADVAERAGYGQVISPLLEDLGVFQRIGDATDVVTKEMYDFVDKSGRHIALRPELTASVCRAFVQHRPATPWKVWYTGSQFRYEKPQRGRYRQFDQVGIEVLGADDPYLDVEIIALGWEFFGALGLNQVKLLLNSLGEPDDRARYVAALQAHFEADLDALSPESRVTLTKNPLRVLDSKRSQDAAIVASAPRIADFYSDAAAAHFEAVQAGLNTLGIPFAIDATLVRGLDYYSRTVFEWITTELGAQGTVCAGGRYDALVELMGGKPSPAIGFAMGLERLLELLAAQSGSETTPEADYCVVGAGEAESQAALLLAESLRDAYPERRVTCICGGGSMKSQMKRADRTGAQIALILGSEELASDTVTLKPLRGQGEQQRVARAALLTTLSNAPVN
jgi:histidyl-tRNA synthetase